MWGFVTKLLKSPNLALVFVGMVAFIIAAAGTLNVAHTELEIGGSAWRVLLAVLGVALVGFGMFLAWPRRAAESEWKDKLYTLSGLSAELRKEDTFQDFEVDRVKGLSINPVQYLWADAFEGNVIEASVERKEHFLTVSFRNNPGSYPSNIAIRAKSESALENAFKKRYLCFDARVSPSAIQDQNLLQNVAIAIRLVNGWLQHWEYSSIQGDYVQFVVTGPDWERFSIDLQSKNWRLFTCDGNHLFGPAKADFRIISCLIFEFGSFNVPGRPGPGSATVDIRRIMIVDQ